MEIPLKRTVSEAVDLGSDFQTQSSKITLLSMSQVSIEDRLSDLSKSLLFQKKKMSRKVTLGIEKGIRLFSMRSYCSCKRLKPESTCERALLLFNSGYKQPEHQFLRHNYQYLCKQACQPNIRVQIAKDVTRTLGEQLGKLYIEKLRQVLQNYSKQRKRVSYVQGMNYIVAALLFHTEEWIAFSLLDMLLFKHGLKGFFLPGFGLLLQSLEQLNSLLEVREPALFSHLVKEEVTPQMYAFSWYLSLFTILLPVQMAISVFEGIAKEGVHFLHKVALAYLASRSQTLLALEGAQLLQQLNSQNYRHRQNDDWDLILQAAASIQLNN